MSGVIPAFEDGLFRLSGGQEKRLLFDGKDESGIMRCAYHRIMNKYVCSREDVHVLSSYAFCELQERFPSCAGAGSYVFISLCLPTVEPLSCRHPMLC